MMENESVVVVELTAFERDFILKALMSIQFTGTATQLAETLETVEGIVEAFEDTEIPKEDL